MNKYHIVVAINCMNHKRYVPGSTIITTHHEAEKMDIGEVAILEAKLNKECKEGIYAQVMSWQKYDD